MGSCACSLYRKVAKVINYEVRELTSELAVISTHYVNEDTS
jgi:hypothetical protein